MDNGQWRGKFVRLIRRVSAHRIRQDGTDICLLHAYCPQVAPPTYVTPRLAVLRILAGQPAADASLRHHRWAQPDQRDSDRSDHVAQPRLRAYRGLAWFPHRHAAALFLEASMSPPHLATCVAPRLAAPAAFCMAALARQHSLRPRLDICNDLRPCRGAPRGLQLPEEGPPLLPAHLVRGALSGVLKVNGRESTMN